MRKTLLALVAGTALMAGLPAYGDESNTNLVTVLTAPEPQTQLMAMVLTMQSFGAATSGSQELPMPSASVSRWSGLVTSMQLSTASAIPSLSPSTALADVAKLSNATVNKARDLRI